MVYKVIWSTPAIETYIGNIEYLEVNWTEKEVKKFINAVKRRIVLLSANPLLAAVLIKGRM